jgi:Mce-associated membrane protein
VRRASRLAIGLMVAVALALAAAVWILFTDLSRLRADETAGREALAAARSVAPDMLSYDYRTIEQDFARAGGYTTGALSLHYRQLARSMASQARKQKTVQQATVTGAGVESVESGDSGRVEVLLFMSMSTVRTPDGEKEPRRVVSQNRARFIMVKKDSRWLVSELSTLLGDPPPP